MKKLVVMVSGLALAASCTSGDADEVEEDSTPEVQAAEFDRMSAAVADVDSVHYTLTQELGERSQTVEMTLGGLSTGDDADLVLRIVMEEGDRRQESIVVGGFQYTQGDFGLEEGHELAGKWVQTPVGEQELAGLRAATPRAFIEDLSVAVVSFEPDGEPEEIDGADAQPYAVTLDPEQLDLFVAPGPADDGEAPTGTFWVGADDLPLRFVGSDAGGEYVFEFSRWNETVDVEAPPEGEIMTEDELRGLGE